MKKTLLAIIGIAAIFAFISCGSTATLDPNSQGGGAAEQPEKEPETQPVSEDFSAANQALIDAAEKARQKAIEAGAEKYCPDKLSETDKIFADAKNEVAQTPSQEHSEKLKDVIKRYEALATASAAKEMKEKADEFGLSTPEGEKALADFESSASGKDMDENAKKALAAYSSLLLQKLGEMAKTERNAALEAKKNADSVKAGVAKKNEYKAASDTFKKADSCFVTKDLPGAYKGYRSAKNSFTSLFEEISAKRAAAQAAIERAKKRVSEAENYTVEADAIAPLTGEVAGIEKEDAVLLEQDTFANPEDAVIDVEGSDEAKAAAAIDDAVNKGASVINNAVNGGDAK
ncbi:MAG: hypothetical protein II821_08550 [Treponema sp.]|nr:hypothetical protein [Treponema sp.]